jgi:prephenate dehydratase
MKISIQGNSGSFHDIAARQLFGTDYTQLQRTTFTEVFHDVQTKQADIAIVAIENSSVGSINEVYDLLLKSGVKIVGELYMRISHNLIGYKHTKLSDIQIVYSHPMAIMQCELFLDTKLSQAEIHERHDTAESVEYVANLKDPTLAAIGSTEAAKLHNLEILVPNIETNKHNYTRFIVLSLQNNKDKNTNKTSIVVTAKNIPGALHKILGIFANRGINLTKIESRPIIGKSWEYYFYIDFESGLNTSITQDALKELAKYTNSIAILGTYQKGKVLE